MNDIIFLSVAFGKQYIFQQMRLRNSILAIYPDANIKEWTNEYPPNSRHHLESLYGFKPHAVRWALDQGYKKIIWLDTACILQSKVDHWFNLGLPVLAVKDDNKLYKLISKKAIDHYDVPSKLVKEWHLVGGSLYVFDFNIHVCGSIFRSWIFAEEMGMFGSQSESSTGKINGHRHDESCMAMAIYTRGCAPVGHDIALYNQGPDSIIIKDHFK